MGRRDFVQEKDIPPAALITDKFNVWSMSYIAAWSFALVASFKYLHLQSGHQLLTSLAILAFVQLLPRLLYLFHQTRASFSLDTVEWKAVALLGGLQLAACWLTNSALAATDLECFATVKALDPILAILVTFWRTPNLLQATSRLHLLTLATATGGLYYGCVSSSDCNPWYLLSLCLPAVLVDAANRQYTQTALRNQSTALATTAVSSTCSLLVAAFFLLHRGTTFNSQATCFQSQLFWLLVVACARAFCQFSTGQVSLGVQNDQHFVSSLKAPSAIALGLLLNASSLSLSAAFGHAVTLFSMNVYYRKSITEISKLITISLAAFLCLHVSYKSAYSASSAFISSANSKPFRLGLVYPLLPQESMNWTTSLASSGGNVGNWIWHEGTRQLYDHASVEQVPLWDDPEPVDATLMTTANLLWNVTGNVPATEKDITLFWLYRLASSLRKAATTPLVVMGVGCNGYFQATGWYPYDSVHDLGSNHPYEPRPELERFTNGSRAFLDAVQSRSSSFFVRGWYTEAASQANGFTKAQAAGCPSLFLNPSPTLGRRLEPAYAKLASKDPSKLRFALPLPPKYLPESMKLIFRVLEQYPGSILVVQDQGDINNLRNAPSRLSLSDSMVQLIESQTRYFTSYKEWLAGYMEVDAVFGFRIHGAMVGLAAEKPTFIVAPDMRVGELAETNMIPWTPPYMAELISPDFDPVKLFSSIRFNGTRFDQNRKEIGARYLGAFQRAGIPPSQTLLTIAQGSSRTWR